MMEDWPFYIQQKVEPMDYDDSVKNDKDFDVSLKHYDYTEKKKILFPLFISVACFPPLYTGIMFSRTLHHFHVLSRLTLLLVFARFAFLAWFPRFQPARVTCFSRSTPLACFPALNTFCIFLFRILIGSLDSCCRNVKPSPCSLQTLAVHSGLNIFWYIFRKKWQRGVVRLTPFK